MTDLRKAAEMALDALEWSWGGEPLGTKEFEAITALRTALAQSEQKPYADKANQLNSDRMQIDPVTGDVSIGTPSKPEKEKESTPSNVDPRLLLGKSNDFTKETGNRLCDIERRLAAIETQPDEATSKKPHAVSYKDGVPVAYYNFDPPPYTAPPSKPWVSLTDEEVPTFDYATPQFLAEKKFARAIEAKLKERNGG